MTEEAPQEIPIVDECLLCEFFHQLEFCPQFLAMTLKRRQRLLKRYDLCFNCLAPTHTPVRCETTQTCERCGGLHHSLLHNPVPARPPKPKKRATLMPSPGMRARDNATMRARREQRRMRRERLSVDAVGSFERDDRAARPTRLGPLRKRRSARSRYFLLNAMRELNEAAV